MKKHKKNNIFNYFSIKSMVVLFLVIILGLLIASNLFSHGSNSYFARIRVAIKKKVQIVYNQNLFDGNKINNKGIKEYDSDKQEITFDGKLEGNYINLGKLNVKLKKGEKYRVTVNYLSGSYDKNGEPKFTFELQKDGNYYTDRKNGTHYIFEMLPIKKDKPIDNVITIKEETKDASNIIYRIYQENEVEFKNYKIQVSITKLESKIGVAGEKYGKLPTPEKDGYEFLGWYDSISGGKKITETNTILKKYNHQLYAHWKKSIHPYRTVNYDNFKMTFYYAQKGPIFESYKKSLNYAIYAPENVSDLNGVSLPVIVWLHGMAERIGGYNEKHLIHAGLLDVVRHWDQYNLEPIPAFIIAPQSNCDGWHFETAFGTIRALLKYLNETYNADLSNVALVGHSMGGYGAASVSNSMQDTYRSVVIMSAKVTSTNKSQDYFKKIRLKGYSEHDNLVDFFKWAEHPNDYYYLPGIKHGDVPKEAFIADKDKNGVSDLVEWLFYEE